MIRLTPEELEAWKNNDFVPPYTDLEGNEFEYDGPMLSIPLTYLQELSDSLIGWIEYTYECIDKGEL